MNAGAITMLLDRLYALQIMNFYPFHFHLPREFSTLFAVPVYVPPSANYTETVMQHMHELGLICHQPSASKVLSKAKATTHSTLCHTRYSLPRVKTNRTKNCFINWCLFSQKNSQWLLTNLCACWYGRICIKYCKVLIYFLNLFILMF